MNYNDLLNLILKVGILLILGTLIIKFLETKLKAIKHVSSSIDEYDLSAIKLGSSNQKKLNEYQELFPNIEGISIRDLPEIMSDKDEVIIYKVKELNQVNIILEDTIIEVYNNDQWNEIVDIKFRVKELKGNLKARWIVSLGILGNDKIIRIYRATLNGTLKPELYESDSFGFDSIFIPEKYKETLKELNLKGIKKEISPRKFALLNLKSNHPIFTVNADSLPEWTGEYQK